MMFFRLAFSLKGLFMRIEGKFRTHTPIPEGTHPEEANHRRQDQQYNDRYFGLFPDNPASQHYQDHPDGSVPNSDNRRFQAYQQRQIQEHADAQVRYAQLQTQLKASQRSQEIPTTRQDAPQPSRSLRETLYPHPAEPGPSRPSDHASQTNFRDMSIRERLTLPAEQRLKAPTDAQGYKTGTFVDSQGSMRSYESSRQAKQNSRDNGKKLRAYFNGHHDLNIPASRRTQPNPQEFRSPNQVLEEANRQAMQVKKDLTYLTRDPEKALRKALAYEQLGDAYQSDGQ
jgi:hypothetical protein